MRLIFWLFIFWTVPAQASAPDLYGYGTRAMGMAGLVASDAKGHDAVYHNPAGLLLGKGPSCAVGFSFGGQSLSLDGHSVEGPNTSQTHIGGAIPLPLGGFMAERLALGFGFVVPTETVLHAYIPSPGTPHFSVVGYRAQTVSLQGAIAIRIHESLSMGGGIIALSTLEGAIQVAPNAEGRIGSSARDQLVAEYAPVWGLNWTPTEHWALGLVYRGESQARFGLPLDANLGENFPLPIPILMVNGTAQYDPRHGEVEIGYRHDHWQLSLGLAWHQWSQFPQPVGDATRPASLPALPGPNFEDRWTVGLSGESSWSTPSVSGALRSGYRFRPTPVPKIQTVHALLDNDRHVLAAGHTLRWKMFNWSVAAQLHHLVESSTRTNALLSDENLTRTHGGQLWILSTEIGVNL